MLDTFGGTAAERASMDIQGIAQDWAGADMTDWTKPLPGLSSPKRLKNHGAACWRTKANATSATSCHP